MSSEVSQIIHEEGADGMEAISAARRSREDLLADATGSVPAEARSREDLRAEATSVGWQAGDSTNIDNAGVPRIPPIGGFQRAATESQLTTPFATESKSPSMFASMRLTSGRWISTPRVAKTPSESSTSDEDKTKSHESVGSMKSFRSLLGSPSFRTQSAAKLTSQPSFSGRAAAFKAQGSFTASVKLMLQRGSTAPEERLAIARDMGKRSQEVCVSYRPQRGRLMSIVDARCLCGELKHAKTHEITHVCRSCGEDFTAESNSRQHPPQCKVHWGEVKAIRSSRILGNKYFWTCCLHSGVASSEADFIALRLPHANYHI